MKEMQIDKPEKLNLRTYALKHLRTEFKGIPMSFLLIFAKRFIAGQTLEEALPVVERLHNEGFGTTLDILGESVTNPNEARIVADEYCRILRELNKRGLETNMSLKLTQLGLDISNDLCFDNVAKILIEAGKTDGFIRVDMEGSAYTQKTLDMVKRWHVIYPNVGTVLQAMLRRTPQDVEGLLEEKTGVRLCKGAYKEPSDVAYQDKRDVDSQYEALMERLMASGIYHGIATHDERLIKKALAFAASYGIEKDKFEFQMLLGIRRDLQRQLLKDGWRVRIYVPYGRAWLQYTLRRLRERKENLLFVIKNLFRG